MDKKVIKIDYDSDVGTTHVDVSNVNDIDIGNALANICRSVASMLLKGGMSPELLERKLTLACAAGIASAEKEHGCSKDVLN